MFDGLQHALNEPYFAWIQKLLQAYPQAEVFLVGGAVRDAALSRSTKDYDFVVRGVQARQLQEFLGTVGIVNLVGRVFGVYKLVPEEGYEEFKTAGLDSFDVALPRTEHAWGTGGYRDVEVQSDHELPIEEDLSRRDFTINAMALKLKYTEIQSPERRRLDLKITDPYGGTKDIEARTVRAVGNARERFEEDYTRMLRALRFACELGFTIEPATMTALKDTMPRINDKRSDAPRPILSPLAEFVAPREVVSRELTRTFYADPVRAFDLYDETGAFEQLMPELLKMKGCPQPEEFHSEGDVWTHTRMALQALGSEEYVKLFGYTEALPPEARRQGLTAPDPHYNALLIMSILLHDVGKPLMLKTPENDGVDRIQFQEHDTVGAALAREIARRLVLSIMEEGPYHVDYDKLHWLIAHHLLLLHTKAEDFKASTVEKYFFNPKNPGEELLRLAFCDGSASLPPGGGPPDISGVHDIMARIKRMESAVRAKQIFVKPLVNGNEIMELLKIPSGPGVGEILAALREEQLSARVTTKEEAIEWVKKSFG